MTLCTTFEPYSFSCSELADYNEGMYKRIQDYVV